MPKRRRQDADGDGVEDEDATPRKTRSARREQPQDQPAAEAETPSRRSILKSTPSKLNTLTDEEPTPKSLRKVLFSTPAKPREEASEPDEQTPTAARNNRSARKKSARLLQQEKSDDMNSDAEEDEGEFALAEEIMEDEAEEEEDVAAGGAEEDAEMIVATAAPDTPSKAKTGRPRGRPKGRKRERTPSPPPDLPPHEQYFFDNRPGGSKTSTNTLPPNLLLSHEDFFKRITAYNDRHEGDIEQLRQLHQRAFDQWVFELEEGFNICLYGYGSKRRLVMDFAEHVYSQSKRTPTIVVVNGYTPGLTIRDVLTTVASQVLPPHETKLPNQPPALLELILATLTSEPPTSTLQLLIHSLDHSNLRKPTTQALLSRLASHPSISLTATCDTPNFPLLWDTTLTNAYRFLYHDATTFEPYRAELDVVEESNTLLGRSGRRLAGKDGVGYVLKSLPENARTLFRILVAEQLASADAEPNAFQTSAEASDDNDDDSILGASDDDAAATNTPSRRRQKRGRPAKKPKTPTKIAKIAKEAVPEGVPYRTLYHKAVEEFVASSEISFRTLLKEFHDHAMIESRRDAMGTERLSVPFGREELEGILEELV
ncbi:hypothetical protein MBLNU230_g2189t1 [Neophaeotheca triangularis]